MDSGKTAERVLTVYRSGFSEDRVDTLVVQSTFTLSVNGGRGFSFVSSPGDLETLVLGHLLTEGWLASCPGTPEITVSDELVTAFVPGINLPASPPSVTSDHTISIVALLEIASAFSAMAVLHGRTGGTHSAALAMDGAIRCHSEDISRSAALERAAGMACREGLPLARSVLLLSSRVPLGFIHKAAHAGIPLIAAISAPTAQAADEAERLGICLCGFVRGSSANVYSRRFRVGL
ncbi:MAG: formate dehydrogenase accessory sulfurtransferase FdhD [Candidatus Fermentibacteraceae bacterium]